jgi:hypothetical protein
MITAPPLPHADARTSQKAVWSLVLGILSIFCIWILGSIPAIILGILALKDIDRSGGALKGKGIGIAGIVTGGVGVLAGLTSVALMASLAIPVFTVTQVKAKAAKQMNEMRQIHLGCRMFANENNGQFPNELGALVPDFISDEAILQWETDPSRSEALPYLYRAGLTDTSAPEEPLIAAPEPILGKRSVNFVSGEVKEVPEDEFQANHADKF